MGVYKLNYDPIVAEVRCPVHGFIGLTDLERKLVDTPAFQRLRRIKQLAWTDYVYPGASHSRFEHSLGVMHIASRLFEAVVKSSRETLVATFGYTDAGLARDWQTVRLAALLHDVGHAPFSHATEHLLPMKAPENYSLFPGETKPPEQFAHEDYSVAIIETVFRDIIEQHPLNRRNAKITASEVSALLTKRSSGGGNLFWKDIISGQLDADRMDYLLRDSLHAGVSYGKFDLDRIVSSVCAIRLPREESDEPKIAIMRGGAYAAEALIVARYWMHKQVYFHKTRLACNFHLEEAVRAILLEGMSSSDGVASYPRPDSVEQLLEFLKWDDYRVMGLLTSGHGGEHGKRLIERDHLRLVCELAESDSTAKELSDSGNRNQAILDALGSLIRHKTQPKTAWYKAKSNDLILVEDDSQEQTGFLSQYSSILKSINFGSSRFLYADRSEVKEARERYQTFLRNESRAERGVEEPRLEKAFEKEEPPAVQGAIFGLEVKPSPKTVQREVVTQKGIQNAS